MLSCPKGQEFVFCDGKVVGSVDALAAHIKELSPDQFKHHVNEQKNDFYNWIHYCISKDTAEDIKNSKTQRDFVEKLTGHVWNKEHKKKHNY